MQLPNFHRFLLCLHKIKPYSGFFKYLFSETVTGKFEKMKTKAMVLVVAKMILNFEYKNVIVKMLVFIKVNESSLVSRL